MISHASATGRRRGPRLFQVPVFRCRLWALVNPANRVPRPRKRTYLENTRLLGRHLTARFARFCNKLDKGAHRKAAIWLDLVRVHLVNMVWLKSLSYFNRIAPKAFWISIQVIPSCGLNPWSSTSSASTRSNKNHVDQRFPVIHPIKCLSLGAQQ